MSTLNVANISPSTSLRLPNLATGSLPSGSGAQKGMMAYDTTTEEVKIYDGTGWLVLKASLQTATVSVSNPTGYFGTDISVKIKINYTSAMNADFSNVFFAADVDGQIKLPYWRESYNSSSAATFWVKTNVPSAGTTFYAHVSPAVTYSGSPGQAFLYYNKGDNIDGWSTNSGCGTFVTNGTVITKEGSCGSAARTTNWWLAESANNTAWDDYIWEYDTRRSVNTGYQYPWASIRVNDPVGSGSVSKWWYEGSNGAGTWRPYSNGSDGGWITNNNNHPRGISDSWERHYLIAVANVGKVLVSTNTFGTADGATTMEFGEWDYGAQKLSGSPQPFITVQNYSFGSNYYPDGLHGGIAIDDHSGANGMTNVYKNLCVRKTFKVNIGATSQSLSPSVSITSFSSS